MVSDEDLRARLRALLPQADLESSTEKSIRLELEKEFGCDLKGQKAIFKEEINSYLETQGDLLEPASPGEPSSTKRKAGIGGAMTMSEAMSNFLGEDADAQMTRNEVVKRLWDYIKANSLQDPKDKRKILLDEELSKLFTTPLNMFSLNKQLSKHVKSSKDLAEPAPVPAKKARTAKEPAAQKEKAPKKDKAAVKAAKEPAAKKEKKEKKPRDPNAPPTGLQRPLKISPEFQAVVGQETISRAQANKALWAYVKEHDLQNPDNKKEILVHKDEKLHALLGVDACQGFTMMTHLKAHFLGNADAPADTTSK